MGLLAAGLVAGLLVGHVHAQTGLDKEITKGNVSIRLPVGWTVQARGNTSLVAMAPLADKEGNSEFVANLSISVRQGGGGKIDGDAQQKLLEREFKDYRAAEKPTSVTVNGQDGVFLGGIFTSNGMRLRSRQYLFAVNNNVYIVTVTSLASQWPTYQGLAEGSVSTFAVGKKPAGPAVATPEGAPSTPGATPAPDSTPTPERRETVIVPPRNPAPGSSTPAVANPNTPSMPGGPSQGTGVKPTLTGVPGSSGNRPSGADGPRGSLGPTSRPAGAPQ